MDSRRGGSSLWGNNDGYQKIESNGSNVFKKLKKKIQIFLMLLFYFGIQINSNLL